MTAKEIEFAVVNYFGKRKNLIVPNVWWGFNGLPYEADLVVVRESGYAVEVEIKVSRADLIKDKQKRHYHDCKKFKELYFAIPEKLLKDIKHIPERAGILVIEYKNLHYRARLERPAIAIKTEPLSLEDMYKLARLGAIRIWDLKQKILNLERRLKTQQLEE